jgi:hypothetical protein
MEKEIDPQNPIDPASNVPETPLESMLESQMPVQKPKPKPRVKPTVEGINSPQVTQSSVAGKPTLTEQEKELISEPEYVKKPAPKLISQSMAVRTTSQKTHHIGRWIASGIVLLIIIAAAYGLYVWNVGKSILPVPGYHSPSGTDQSAGGLPIASSTLGALPIETATNSTSSAMSATGTPVTATSTASSTAGTVKPINQVKVNNTPTGYLNVRSTPSSSASLVTQVHPGETYPYTKKQSGWFEITLPNGQTGWVSGQYVTAQ